MGRGVRARTSMASKLSCPSTPMVPIPWERDPAEDAVLTRRLRKLAGGHVVRGGSLGVKQKVAHPAAREGVLCVPVLGAGSG